MKNLSVLMMRFSLAYLLLLTGYSNLANYSDVSLYYSQAAYADSGFIHIVLMSAYIIGAAFMILGRYLCCTSTLLGVLSVVFARFYHAEFVWVLSLGLGMLAVQLLLTNKDGCRDVLWRRLSALKNSVLPRGHRGKSFGSFF